MYIKNIELPVLVYKIASRVRLTVLHVHVLVSQRTIIEFYCRLTLLVYQITDQSHLIMDCRVIV